MLIYRQVLNELPRIYAMPQFGQRVNHESKPEWTEQRLGHAAH